MPHLCIVCSHFRKLSFTHYCKDGIWNTACLLPVILFVVFCGISIIVFWLFFKVCRYCISTPMSGFLLLWFVFTAGLKLWELWCWSLMCCVLVFTKTTENQFVPFTFTRGNGTYHLWFNFVLYTVLKIISEAHVCIG